MTRLAAILAAGSASASDVALKGGMSLVDPALVTAALTGVAGVLTAAGTALWCRSRAARREDSLRAHIANELRARITNDPLAVRPVADCVPVAECNRRMRALEERMDKVERRLADGLDNILRKLDAMDERGEKRSCDIHLRVDTLAERTAQLTGEVGMIKDKMFANKRK